MALFATIGVYMPFFPVFLAARGFAPEAIGLAMAVPVAVRLAALPVAGILSDRLDRPRAVLAGLGILSAGAVAAVLSVDGYLIVVALALATLLWSPAFPLLESYAVRLAAAGAIDYGRVRLWGSAAFIAANLAAGWALDLLPVEAIVWLMAAPLIPFAVIAAVLPRLPRAEPAAVGARPFRPAAYFVLGVAAAAFVQSSHATLYALGSVHWAANGIDALSIGALWSVGVVAEILLFQFSARAFARAAPLTLIAIGGGAAIVRFLALSSDPPVAMLFPLQLLHGLTFGAAHLGLMALIGGVPARAAGRAQSFAATAIVLTMACATVVSGPLYAAFGPGAFLASACLGGAGGILAWFARRLLSGRANTSP